MAEKYGQGNLFEKICEKCGFKAEGLYSAGVHESPSGVLRVYSDDQAFTCPTCGPEEELLTGT